MVTIKVSGLSALEASLRQFPKELQARALADGVSAAAGVVQIAIRAAAPVGGSDDRGHRIQKGRKGRFAGKGRMPGFLRAAVLRQRVHDGNAHGVTYAVRFNKAAYYWWFVERGFRHFAGRITRVTKGGYRKYAGASHVAARPFATPAFERSQAAAGEALRARLASWTDRLVAASRRS